MTTSKHHISTTEYRQQFYQPYVRVDKHPEVSTGVEKLFPTEKWKVKRNLAMYIINLLRWRKVAVSRRCQWFCQHHLGSTWHTLRMARRAQNLLAEKGLAVMTDGYKTRKNEPGMSTVLHATTKLLVLFSDFEAGEVELDTE
jgi:hypothetical protein